METTVKDGKKLLVFLSHASEDKPKVRKLCRRLREDGFDPWLDEERLLPGQDWNLEIEKALRASGAILLCFSKLSVAKEGYIQREYKRAKMFQEEKPEGTVFNIPVRLDDCEIPFVIHDLQWVDYPDDYDKLVKSLQLRAGGSTMTQQSTQPEENKSVRKKGGGKTGIGNIHIEGGVHAGRDVVMGNQSNVYYQNQQTINITSADQFVDELQKLKEEIARLKSQPGVEPAAARRLTAVEGDLEGAISEAGKEKPVGERIKSTLDGAKETMDKLGGSVASAINLGTALGSLAMIAMKLFGG